MSNARVVVSRAIPVFKGEKVVKGNGQGFVLVEVECDGIYIDALSPILSRDEVAVILAHIDEVRAEELRESRRERRRELRASKTLTRKGSNGHKRKLMVRRG